MLRPVGSRSWGQPGHLLTPIPLAVQQDPFLLGTPPSSSPQGPRCFLIMGSCLIPRLPISFFCGRVCVEGTVLGCLAHSLQNGQSVPPAAPMAVLIHLVQRPSPSCGPPPLCREAGGIPGPSTPVPLCIASYPRCQPSVPLASLAWPRRWPRCWPRRRAVPVAMPSEL